MTQDDRVVDLPDAGVPADQGLSSLGLLMQLGGNVFAAIAVFIAFTVLFDLQHSHGSANSDALWIFVLIGMSIARSMFLRSAGAQLLYGSQQDANRLGGMRRYITFALVQCGVFVAVLVIKWHTDMKIALSVGAGLAVWPAALAVLMALPRFQRYREDLPITEDKGFEGASILMTVLGLCGLIGGGAILLYMLELPSGFLQSTGVLLVLAVGMLVARSAIHVQAGLSGLRETSVDRSVELANRYANFGIISAFCAGGALLLFIMRFSVDLMGLVLISVTCWMLMTWPLTIRRFFSDRQFAELLAGENAPTHRRAPDAGLTGLGWLLVAWGVLQASLLIPVVAINPPGAFALGGGARSVWWSVAIDVMQLWAGYELVRMSPQSRMIARVYGAVGAALTLYISWPLIELAKHSRELVRMGPSATILIAQTAIALVLPVATLVLVNRKIAPTARARFRTKPPEEAPPLP